LGTALIPFSALAQEGLLSASEAKEAVASSERLEPELQEAGPTKAELIYVLLEGEYVPRYWLVLLSGPEGPVGVVGIDPETGALGIEYAVGPDYTFPQFDPEKWQESLANNGIDPGNYRFDEVRLVWQGGMVKANTWVLPPVEGPKDISVAITTFPRKELEEYLSAQPSYQTEAGRLVYEDLEDLLPETRQSDWAMKEEQESEPSEEEEIAPPTQQGLSKQATRTDKQLVGDVPFYQQGNTQWCALFALSMMHQWWSPTQLGTGRQQAGELGNYLNHGTGQGTTMSEMRSIMNDWDVVGPGYQHFRTTYVGTGEYPIQDGLRNGETDEIKSMISYLDAPVGAVVDSDGGGSGSDVDHVVLVTGYDDQTDKLFIHNSGATLGNSGPDAGNAVSYGDWNNKYWNAKWWDNPVFNNKDRRYGIVTGYPGDMSYAKLSSVTPDPATFQISDIEDDKRAPVNDIGLTVGQDPAKESQDAFGESYETTVEIRRTGSSADPKNVSSGDFDRAGTPTLTFRHNSGLQTGTTLGGGSVEWDPAVPGRFWNLGDVGLEFTYTASDREDRFHYYGRTVSVFDDRGSGRGNIRRMPKPVLFRAQKQFDRSFTVTDDDDSGPLITNPKPNTSGLADSNWPSGPLTVKADVTDPSGVAEVKFHYEVLDSNGNRLHSGSGGPSSQSGSTYSFDIPRSEWAQPGRKVEWWVEATDDDQDGGGSTADRATFTSPKQPTLRLYDDDIEAPAVAGRNSSAKVITSSGQKKVEYEIKFKLEDPSTNRSVSSGVLNSSSSPTVYVRWGNKTVTPNKFDRSFTPTKSNNQFGTGTFTAPIDKRNTALYWLVETEDTDSDRPGDQSSSTPGPFELRLPAKLVITPNPPDHDFGANADGSWSFTAKNNGGGNVKMWGEVDGPLQRVKPSGTSIPTCNQYSNGDRCWLSLSGLSPLNTSALVVSGGTSQQIQVNVDYTGFSYQVAGLPAGAYKAPIKIWDDVKYTPGSGNPLKATIKFSVPKLQVTAPQKGEVLKKGNSKTIQWNSSFMSTSAKVKIELLGATTAVISDSTANDGSYTWTVPTSANDGQHRIEIRPVDLPSVSATSDPFDIGSLPPDRPTNQSPSDGKKWIADPLTLGASSFSDPNQGDSHQKSQWQIRTDEAGNVDPPVYGDPSSREPPPVWSTTATGSSNLTSIQVPQGTLPRHKAARSLTVQATPQGPEDPNGNDLKRIEANQCQLLSITLDNPSSNSSEYRLVFQYGGDYISNWVAPGSSDRLSFRVGQFGTTQWSLQKKLQQGRDIVEKGQLEVANAKYFWHVRYQDDKGTWSKWSKETSFCALEQPQTVAGTVFYPVESQGSLQRGYILGGLTVQARHGGSVLKETAAADQGKFQFRLSPGVTYQIGTTPRSLGQALGEAGGEINIVDALRVAQASVGQRPFAGPFQKKVADVDGDGDANTVDALQIARRSVGQISGFEAGAWAASTEEVELGSEGTSGIGPMGAEQGDANLSGGTESKESAVQVASGQGISRQGASRQSASGGPAAQKAGPGQKAGLGQKVGLGREEGSVVEVPVRLTEEVEVGAFQLKLSYPAEKVAFEGASVRRGKVLAHAEDGTVQVGWFDRSGSEPLPVGENGRLVVLKFQVKFQAEEGDRQVRGEASLEPEGGSIAGPEGEPIGNATVELPRVELGPGAPEAFALRGARPNPATGPVRVGMDLPGEAAVTVTVYNTLGQRVRQVEEVLPAGSGRRLRLETGGLPSGQYFYRVEARMEGGTRREEGRFTVVR
jgi:hypothetical protein